MHLPREPSTPGTVAQALACIPCGQFVATAAHEGARSGVLATWVQPCATNPRLVMVAVPTTLPVIPLIRDSRSFALCQIAADDRFLARKFGTVLEHGEDPFVSLITFRAVTGAPIIERAMSYLDCELIRHVDLEADYGLFVGRVRAGAMLSGGDPSVVVGSDG